MSIKKQHIQLAQTFDNIERFRREHRSIYRDAQRQGWLPELMDAVEAPNSDSKNQTPPRDSKRGYTKTECINVAFRYIYRSEFKQNASGHYHRAREQGWLDEVCRHMVSKRKNYTLLELVRIAEKYLYYADFIANEPSYTHIAKENNWLTTVTLGLVRQSTASPDEIMSLGYDDVVHYARHCQTEQEFNEKFPIHQERARGQGWLEDCYQHIRVTHPITKPTCRSIALCYKDRSSLKHYAPSIYNRIYAQKWKNDCLSHMEKGSRGRSYIDCQKEAQKYTTRKAFSQHSSTHYKRAAKKGWLDDICIHMTVVKSPAKTKLECAVEARKYQSRRAFQLNSPAYYQAAQKLGCVDEICAFMPQKTPPRTKDQCLAVAKKYTNERAFKRHDRSVYERAKRQNWLTDCYAVFSNEELSPKDKKQPEIQKKRAKPRTKEQCLEIALKYSSRSDFQKYSSPVYQRAYKQGWLNDVCAHMMPPQLSNSLENCQAIASMYATETELRKCSPTHYLRARKQGWLGELAPFYTTKGHSLYDCIKAAKKVSTMKEFMLRYPNLSQIIESNKWHDKVVVHFKPLPKKITYRTCHQEAQKYMSISEFKRKAPHEYQAAKNNNWLDKLYQDLWATKAYR